MRKFTTTVRLCLTLAFVFTASANAKSDEKYESPLSKAVDMLCDTKRPATYDKKKCDEALKKALNSGSDNTQPFGCEGDYQATYKKAEREFVDACGEANVAIGSVGGDIGCGYALARCKCFNGSLSPDEKVALGCSDVSDKVRGSNGKLDADSAKRMFSYCPAMAGPDYKKKVDNLEKSDEKIEKMEEKMPGLKEGILKANREAMEKQDNLQDEENKLDEKHQTDLAEAKKNMSEEQRKIMDQMSGIQAQIATIDEQIGQYDLGKVDAGNRKRDELLKIDNSCRALAVNQVTKRIDKDSALLQAGQLNRGGQRAMLQRNGLSDRNGWQREADRYYRQCQVDPGIIDQKEAVERVFSLAMQQSEKAKKDLRNRKRLLQEQLVKMKDPSGACGAAQTSSDGSSNETEMCRSAREAYEKQMNVENAYMRQKQGIFNKKQRAAMAGQQEVQAKTEEARLAQRNLDNVKGRRDKLQDWKDTADSKNVSETDAKSFGKAQAKFTDFKTQVQNLVTCSVNDDPPKSCEEGTECGKAKRFHNLIGGGIKLDTERATPRPSSPAQTASEDPPASDVTPTSGKPAPTSTPAAK